MLVIGTASCGLRALAAPAHDLPVPKEEPRATLRLRLDLPRSSACEEAFDLALYQHKGVELVEWEGNVARCGGRTARIRYLPKKLGRDDLLKNIRKLAEKAEVVEG